MSNRLIALLLMALCWSTATGAAEEAAGPHAPAEALAALTAPDDLVVEQVLAEPVVRQPVFMNFDERGRMWVVEYLQYPYPAGIKILSEDKFLRAVYDKVPPAPPNHFPGLDKISIHEDTDGDGTFDAHKTFIEGLNIVTSVARGRGGVWVLNPPYLLFYPDRNNDDVPDGDPEVRLEGFGIEDTHSCASCLCWGPDGWLYAAQGSTVSGHVKRPGVDQDKDAVHSLGQLIWRYHPEERRYEIFAEGGGNAFGVEVDSKGRIFSGHNGGDTRGFHYVQGGYSQKGFAKHGPLSNPYAFGYFPAMKHPSVPRFTHALVIYEGGALPQAYRGNLLGVAPLLNHVVHSQFTAEGSTFQTTDLGHPITSSDPWFRPVDIKVGPDGAVYVADFYEGQIGHLRHHAGDIDTTNGRIYRLQAKGQPASKHIDLAKLSSDELVDRLASDNKWVRHTALRLLGDRADPAIVPRLKTLINESAGQLPLEALWALNLSGGLDDSAAIVALGHADPHVRLWAVRLMCDDKQVSPAIAARLMELARTEPHVEVRSQLACSARRLPAVDGLAIVRGLLRHDADVADPHVPLLIWWAIESKAQDDRDAIRSLFSDADIWRMPLVEQHLLSRLMRRYAAAGTRRDLVTCARLFALAPDAERKGKLTQGFEEAFQGRSLADLPDELARALADLGGGSVVLQVRQGSAEAVAKALATIDDDSADARERLELIQVFGQVSQPQCVPRLLVLAERTSDDALRMAALASLGSYNEPSIGAAVAALYGKLSPDAQAVAQTLLASRKPWAIELLTAVEAGHIAAASIGPDAVRKLTVHRDDRIAELVARHWGAVEGATTAQMQGEIGRLEAIVRDGSGSPYDGKKLFTVSCGKCHVLFGQGGQIGPDLTAFKRADFSNILTNVVNPSAEIREGFETVLVITDDGRAVSGFLVERDSQTIVLRGVDGLNTIIPTDSIEEMAPLKKSLMPEGLLKDLTDKQVRDLFAYVRSTQWPSGN